MKVRWKTEATQKAALGAVNMRLTADNSDPHTMTGRQEVSVGKVLVKRKLDRKVHFDEASFGGDSTYRAFCAVDVLAEATGVSITQWQQRIRRVAHLLATDMVQNLTHINLKERPVKGASLNIVQAAVQNCLEMYESSFSGRWWQEEGVTPHTDKGVVLELIRCWCLGVSPTAMVALVNISKTLYDGLQMIMAVVVTAGDKLYGVAPLDGVMRDLQHIPKHVQVGEQWKQLTCQYYEKHWVVEKLCVVMEKGKGQQATLEALGYATPTRFRQLTLPTRSDIRGPLVEALWNDPEVSIQLDDIISNAQPTANRPKYLVYRAAVGQHDFIAEVQGHYMTLVLPVRALLNERRVGGGGLCIIRIEKVPIHNRTFLLPSQVAAIPPRLPTVAGQPSALPAGVQVRGQLVAADHAVTVYEVPPVQQVRESAARGLALPRVTLPSVALGGLTTQQRLDASAQLLNSNVTRDAVEQGTSQVMPPQQLRPAPHWQVESTEIAALIRNQHYLQANPPSYSDAMARQGQQQTTESPSRQAERDLARAEDPFELESEDDEPSWLNALAEHVRRLGFVNDDLDCGLVLAQQLLEEQGDAVHKHWQRMIASEGQQQRRACAELWQAASAVEAAADAMQQDTDSLARQLKQARDEVQACGDEALENISAGTKLQMWAKRGIAPISPPLLIRILHEMLCKHPQPRWASVEMRVFTRTGASHEVKCLIGRFQWASVAWQTSSEPWRTYYGHMEVSLEFMHWLGTKQPQPPMGPAHDTLTWPLFPMGAKAKPQLACRWGSNVGLATHNPQVTRRAVVESDAEGFQEDEASPNTKGVTQAYVPAKIVLFTAELLMDSESTEHCYTGKNLRKAVVGTVCSPKGGMRRACMESAVRSSPVGAAWDRQHRVAWHGDGQPGSPMLEAQRWPLNDDVCSSACDVCDSACNVCGGACNVCSGVCNACVSSCNVCSIADHYDAGCMHVQLQCSNESA